MLTFKTNQSAVGSDIQLLHAKFALLNVSIPDDERLSGSFGPATVAAVRNFQQQHSLPITGIVDAATASALEAAIAALHPPTHAVSGHVYSTQRPGVGGLQVQVVDKNVGPDILLAAGVTDDHGVYSIAYSVDSLAPRGKRSPDLQVRVRAGVKSIGDSQVRYGASTSETLDVILRDDAAALLPTEHDTLTALISRYSAGPLRELQESEERSDITYLANKTECDPRSIAMAILADQWSHRSGPTAPIPAAFFYALFRAGVAPDEKALYNLDSASLTKIWRGAVERGVIAADSTKQIPTVVRQFESHSAQRLLTGPALAGVSSLDALLSGSRLSAVQQREFATLYVAHRNDTPAFWRAIESSFGDAAATRLQFDGKLALLTLNHAPLMQSLRQSMGSRFTDPIQLAEAGYHRTERWQPLLTNDMVIPPEIPGASADEKRRNYAAHLAREIRRSYPTASIAQLVGELSSPFAGELKEFLRAHQQTFRIGIEHVQQYLARNQVAPPSARVFSEVKRLERLYQITPHDQALLALLDGTVGSAFEVAQQGRAAFIESQAGKIDARDAAIIHDRSVHIHHVVLNIAVSYATARKGVSLGAPQLLPGSGGAPGGRLSSPGPASSAALDSVGTAYPTLEQLFGSMDYCTCDHCRSMLSPAAYLVDLLRFIDQPTTGDAANPLQILFSRRPDIQHLPLTCENTNTSLPYVDLVNETLEYFIANAANPLSLEGYVGHDTGSTSSEELMSNPQYVLTSAYDVLKGQFFPPPLPFDRALTSQRLHFDKLEVSLALAMERLRTHDNLERGDAPYGWRDILAEELRLSREEYELLTDGSLPFATVYGFPPGMSDLDMIAELSNPKRFARRVGVSYEELVALLETRFVNPNSDLLPKLERLAVPFETLKAFKVGELSLEEFLTLLPAGAGAPDAAQYGGDFKAWVTQNFSRIEALITLTGPSDVVINDFGQFELRHLRPPSNAAGNPDNRLTPAEFVRLLRFIRLWRKLGWSIEQVDAAICSLFPAGSEPLKAEDVATVPQLDAGFTRLLPRLGGAVRVLRALHLTADRDLQSLLACWRDMTTHGDGALYRGLFLNPATLGRDAAFSDDVFGHFPTGSSEPLLAHAEALRAALGLDAEEFSRTIAALGFGDSTKLTLSNITALYRRAWLARQLRVSVKEFLLLSGSSGIDPFIIPEPPAFPMERLIALVEACRGRSLTRQALLYLIWNQDLSGRSAPAPDLVNQWASALRSDFAATDDQFNVVTPDGGDVMRARVALAYGEEVAQTLFALLDDTIVFDVAYTQPAPQLASAILDADPGLQYDPFQHRLSRHGLLTEAKRDELQALPSVSLDFKQAVDTLFRQGQRAADSLLARFPELKAPYLAYRSSDDLPEVKRAEFLAAFSPALINRRKRQQALQRLSTAAGVDVAFAQTLVDPADESFAPAAARRFPIHAAASKEAPALDDIVSIEIQGLLATFADPDGNPPHRERAVNLAYGVPDNPLPAGASISASWQGRIEAPESGNLNFVIQADVEATVGLRINGHDVPLVQTGDTRRNAGALPLQAGALYQTTLSVTNVKDVLRVQWETPTRPLEVIPARYLYPPDLFAQFTGAYVRFLKASALASALSMTGREVAHFALLPALFVKGDGWLNALRVDGTAAPVDSALLLKPVESVLAFSQIKTALSPTDERLLAAIRSPNAATQSADALLFALTGWDQKSLTDLLAHLGRQVSDLADFDLFRRVYDAFSVVQRLGLPAGAALDAAVNAPTPQAVTKFEAALRARYDAASWREALKPLHDALRSLQRDALVSHAVHQMRNDPDTAAIDTPDKLFEYFLMDVEMDPCMQTSRILHALSTVQLFIERCVMNLEGQVDPSVINLQHWQWMKRYRLWEANRKLFLYPENWLEPELRDDKSPFFREIESVLLQGDVTDDSALSAFLTYLSRLDEVAKLEPCSIHYVEALPESDELMHVVARTSGHKYYYRRFEHGVWTAWDPIRLEISDNPVVPVVWQHRLLLFWLKLSHKGPDVGQKSPKPVTELRGTDIPDPIIKLQAVLCWSEYYDGAWQAAKTSDVNLPAVLEEAELRALLTADEIALATHVEADETLRVAFSTPVPSPPTTAFVVHNTHSLPELDASPDPEPPERRRELVHDWPSTLLELRYWDVGGLKDSQVLPNRIDTKNPTGVAKTPAAIVEPLQDLTDRWASPFFYTNHDHVFLVRTDWPVSSLREFQGYGVKVRTPAQDSPFPAPASKGLPSKTAFDPIGRRREKEIVLSRARPLSAEETRMLPIVQSASFRPDGPLISAGAATGNEDTAGKS